MLLLLTRGYFTYSLAMTSDLIIPTELKAEIFPEETDFVVESKAIISNIEVLQKILLIAFIVLMVILGGLVYFDLVRLTIALPVVFLVLGFLVIGVLMKSRTLDALLPGGVIAGENGGYFAATSIRLICYDNKGKIVSMDWKYFSGDILLKKHGNKGDIYLRLRPGKINQASRYSGYFPKQIKMMGIEDFIEVEKICRDRIKEHDPTPSRTRY